MSECPFKVGDRVRVKPAKVGQTKYTRGVVIKVSRPYRGLDAWEIRLRRDGAAKGELYRFGWWADGPDFGNWEHVPAVDVTLDEAAGDLARAVLGGDLVAARALADRVFELTGGPP